MTESGSNRSIRIEESAIGSAIISGDGNTIYVIQQAKEQRREETPPVYSNLGPNPYKGLAAFQESDADRYFGREVQVERLWQRFRDLYEQSQRSDAVPRFLPILGPSGCGKSSLVRAGFIPELAQRPLPGKDSMRVAVLVPGTRPLEALAGVLAKAATDDPLPVEKAEEFERVLQNTTETGTHEGLRRIASAIPGIREVPLVVLVDQFEEVYSLCKDLKQQRAFIDNLLHAASDPSGEVSVVITLRSDFLAETQRHEGLNPVIGSDQSVIVPAMTAAELRRAIAEPARKASHAFEEAVVDLLVKDTEGREGALPLLQFALTRIWDGLSEGSAPAVTYRKMGGVGGALAGKAQEIYEKLSATEQEIARRVFVGLVQLGEGTDDTRRRVFLANLKGRKDRQSDFHEVIRRFIDPSARLITLGFNQNQQETAEITHEALFKYWRQYQKWLDENREVMRFHRRLESTVIFWDETGRKSERLWRSTDLDALKKYRKDLVGFLTETQIDFLERSIWREKTRQGISLFLTLFAISIPFVFIWEQSQSKRAIESVFLGASSDEILRTLPNLKKSADRWRSKVDKLQASNDPQAAVDYYNRHKRNIQKSIAYYRKILTATIQLEQEASINTLQKEKLRREIGEPAETSLAELIYRYRIPELQLQLGQSPPLFGKFIEKDRAEFEEQYTEGALRTTYEILMQNSGAGADLNNDGYILSVGEARQMPCQTLMEIEKLWLEATNKKCGWYTSENKPYVSAGCEDIDSQKRSLYASIFGYDQNFDLDRIKYCKAK